MRQNLKSLLAASALVAGLIAAPALYAQDGPGASQPPMADRGTMGQGGMMNMTGQMSEMMETCSKMMQGMRAKRGSERPNEQWQEGEPGQPDSEG